LDKLADMLLIFDDFVLLFEHSETTLQINSDPNKCAREAKLRRRFPQAPNTQRTASVQEQAADSSRSHPAFPLCASASISS